MTQYNWNTTWLEEHDARVAADTKLEMALRMIEGLEQTIKELQKELDKEEK
jgi:hypothetical protein